MHGNAVSIKLGSKIKSPFNELHHRISKHRLRHYKITSCVRFDDNTPEITIAPTPVPKHFRRTFD